MKYTMLKIFAAQIYWSFAALAILMVFAVTRSYFTEGNNIYNNTPMLIGLYFTAGLIYLLGVGLRKAIQWLARFI